MEPSELKSVLGILKTVLKRQKLTYARLAARMRVSESGLKKTFVSKDCSFRRLESICAALGVSLADVLAEARNAPIRKVEFTPAQQDQLAKHRDLFIVYWKLVYERLDPDEIRAAFRLTDAQLFRYLRRLDQLNLIRLLPKNQIRLPKVEPVRWTGQGPLVEQTYREWSSLTLEDARSDNPAYRNEFIFRYYKLTEESRRDLVRSLKQLEDEFLRRTIREMSTYKSALTSVRLLCAVSEGDFLRQLK